MEGGGPRRGQADRAEVGFGQRLRLGEGQPDSFAFRRARQAPAEARGEARRQGARRRHADELTQYGAHGELEAVERAGDAQARMLRELPGERSVAPEIGLDRLRHRVEVEEAPHPREHADQRGRGVGQLEGERQVVAAG